MVQPVDLMVGGTKIGTSIAAQHQRGAGGDIGADCLSDTHEWTDQKFDGDTEKQSREDQTANEYGRIEGLMNPSQQVTHASAKIGALFGDLRSLGHPSR